MTLFVKYPQLFRFHAWNEKYWIALPIAIERFSIIPFFRFQWLLYSCYLFECCKIPKYTQPLLKCAKMALLRTPMTMPLMIAVLVYLSAAYVYSHISKVNRSACNILTRLCLYLVLARFWAEHEATETRLLEWTEASTKH